MSHRVTLRRILSDSEYLTSTVVSDEYKGTQTMVEDLVRERDSSMLKVLVDCCSSSLFGTKKDQLMGTIRSGVFAVTILRQFMTLLCAKQLEQICGEVLAPLIQDQRGLVKTWFAKEFHLMLPPILKEYLRWCVSHFFPDDLEFGAKVVVTLFLFRVVIPYIRVQSKMKTEEKDWVTRKCLNEPLISEVHFDPTYYQDFVTNLLQPVQGCIWSNLDLDMHLGTMCVVRTKSPPPLQRLRKAHTFQ